MTTVSEWENVSSCMHLVACAMSELPATHIHGIHDAVHPLTSTHKTMRQFNTPANSCGTEINPIGVALVKLTLV